MEKKMEKGIPWEKLKVWLKRKKLYAVLGILLFFSLVGAAAAAAGDREDSVYKETKVQYGTLAVGVTESGTVDIGTVEQTFDLDMSALERVERGSTGDVGSGGNANGAGNTAGVSGAMPGAPAGGGASVSLSLFQQIMGGGSSFSASGEDSSLTVSEVCVSVGQQVAEGDVLYTLEEESVSELEEILQSNVEKAKADLDAVYADQELSRITAEYTYQSSLAYESYAQAEYEAALAEAEETAEQAAASLTRAKETLADYEEQYGAVKTACENAAEWAADCQYSLDATSVEDVYGYVYYYNLNKEAQSSLDSLEKQKEQLESSLEMAQSNVVLAETSWHAAARELEQQKLSAKQTLQLRELAYRTARETYDIALAYLEEDASAQETIYQEAQEEWEEYSSHISGTNVCAAYHGVITSVELAAGDSISTGTVLVTLYDMEEVTMTVTVYEEDMTHISLGSAANISFTAYPEELFTATVTDISDAAADNSGNVYVEVTVTIQGDASGLFQGMTGDITFVSEQSEEGLYVRRRAVITEGDKSYVKVKEENGSITRKEVTTGFTDGTNIQITGDLAEGDTVLIESGGGGA